MQHNNTNPDGTLVHDTDDPSMMTRSSTANTRDAARLYKARGFSPIPIPAGQKAPVLRDWPNFRIGDNDDLERFEPGGNLGLLCGEPSGGLIDLDLDHPITVAAAPECLPSTGMIHGRMANPTSHYWYRVEGEIKTTKFIDADGEVLLEVRGTGAQTVVPPSLHSGERVQWEVDGEPARIDADVLMRAAATLATVTLLARHWPRPSTRQDTALAIAGLLLRGDLPTDEARRILLSAARAAGDEEAAKRASVVEYTTARIAARQPATGAPRLSELLGDKVARRIAEWLGLEDCAGGAQLNRSKRASAATRLVEVVQEHAELFHSPDRVPFATFTVGGHRETWAIGSQGFEDWLRFLFFEAERAAPADKTIKEARGTLGAFALFEGQELDVHLRVAQLGDNLYLDLADSAWRTVEISADGWRLADDPPLRFRRSRGMLPLPPPARGGAVEELFEFVNRPSEDDWRLLVGWLLFAFFAHGPHPILCLHGEQGSAKSTTARFLRALVDPNKAPTRAEPGNERDLAITADNGWIVCADNLSAVSAHLADGLCRLSTGGGFSTRTLYANREEEIFEAQRPIILTAIEEVATRPDLLDRALLVRLPHIPETARRPESQLWADFAAAAPRILGALLDVLAATLAALPDISLRALPRMADFARTITAAEAELGWSEGAFIRTLTANRAAAHDAVLDGSPVASAVRALVEHAPFRGTASELLDALKGRADETTQRQRDWPKNPRGLSGQLSRLAPALRAIGIDIAREREPGERRRRIINIVGPVLDGASQPSPASYTADRVANQGGCGTNGTIGTVGCQDVLPHS